MEKQASIKRNFIMNAILNASAFIFPLITFTYASRVVLPVGTGKVAFATSALNYFSMVAMLGIPTYGIRACAQVRDDKEKLSRTTQEIFTINLVMSVLVYAVFLVTLFTVPKFRADTALMFVMSSTIVFNLIGMEWLDKALEQYTYITIRSLIFKALAVVLLFLLVHNPDDYVFYGLTTVVAASASNIMNLINARKYIFMKPVGGYDFRQHFKPIGVFFAMSVATTIYTNLDTLMLGFMKGDAETGYYNAAVKVKTIVVSLVTSIGTVLLPRVSYYIEKKMEKEFKSVTAKAFNVVVLMALPLVIYFMFCAKETMKFLAPEYMNAVFPMQVIMPSVFLIGLTNVMGIQILVPQGRENMVLVSEIVGAIVNVILNALWIPMLGSTGAALGTLAAEFAVLVVQAIALKDFLKGVIKEVRIGKILLSCVIAFAATFGVHRIGPSNNFLMLVLTAVVFFGVYGILLLALKEPMMYDTMRGLKQKVLKR